MDVGDFAKTERLRATLTEYQEEVDAGRRNRSAPYELAIASGRALKRGQRIRYYMVGTSADIKGFESAKPAEEWNPTFPDENVQYYLRRIDELSSKFEAFFSLTDHRAIFSADDLFPFDPTGIKVVTRTIEPVSSEQSVEENEE